MVTGYIMEFDTIIVEVVEHSQTGLIPLSVVRLGSSSSETSCGQLKFSRNSEVLRDIHENTKIVSKYVCWVRQIRQC